MCKRMTFSIVAIVVLALSVSSVWAEMMPEGVTLEVLKELPASHLPGIAKVRLVELRMAPGAKWPHPITEAGFCTGMKGSITVVKGEKTNTHFAGDTWVMKKAPMVTAYNRGTVEHVQRMWLLIEDKKP